MDFEAEQTQNPYASPTAAGFYQPDPAAMAPRQSGLGIASFVISILGGVAMFALVAIAGVMQATNPGGVNPQASATILLGLSILGVAAMHVVGLGLGVAGLAQANRAKTLAVLGLVFNALVIFAVCGMMALGMAAG